MKEIEKSRQEKIEIGKITSPHGIKGEVKLYPYSDNFERFKKGKTLIVGDISMEVESSRLAAPHIVAKFKSVTDRNGAEELVRKIVYIPESELEELPEGSYYVRDIIGITVNDKSRGKMGKISDVIQSGAQDLYELKLNDGRKLLIPAVGQYVLLTDTEKKLMEVDLPPEFDELIFG